MVSSMRGMPVCATPDGHLIDVRTGGDIGPAQDEDDTVEEHDEGFFFGGYVAFGFNPHTRQPSGVRTPCMLACCTDARVDTTVGPEPSGQVVDARGSVQQAGMLYPLVSLVKELL